jgi:hypothetical protein
VGFDIFSKHSLPSTEASLTLPARKIANPKESYLCSSLIFCKFEMLSPTKELKEIIIIQIVMSEISLDATFIILIVLLTNYIDDCVYF